MLSVGRTSRKSPIFTVFVQCIRPVVYISDRTVGVSAIFLKSVTYLMKLRTNVLKPSTLIRNFIQLKIHFQRLILIKSEVNHVS